MTEPDPVIDVWELLFTVACDYRDAVGNGKRSEARLIDALMPIVEAYGDARVAARPAEPTGELREEIRDGLGGWPVGSGYYQYTVGIDDAAEMADALLSGPLAPLLARLRAVEALVAFYDRHEYTTLVVDDLRRAIAEEAS